MGFFNLFRSDKRTSNDKNNKSSNPVYNANASFSSIAEQLIFSGARFSKYTPDEVVTPLVTKQEDVVVEVMDSLLKEVSITQSAEFPANIGPKACQVAYEAGILAIIHWKYDPNVVLAMGIPNAILSFGYPSDFESHTRKIGFYNSSADNLKPVFKSFGDTLIMTYAFDSQNYWDAMIKMMSKFYLLGLQAALPMLGAEYNP